MTKPVREFWIVSEDRECWDKNPTHYGPHVERIHVIEYSAFETLLKKCQSLEAEVVALRSIITLLNPDWSKTHEIICNYRIEANRIRDARGQDNPNS